MAKTKGILKLLGLENLASNIKSLVDTQIQLFRYELKEELAKSLSTVIVDLIIVGLAIFTILFLSLGLSIYLGVLFDNHFYGFFAVGAFYLTLLVLLLFFKDKIGLTEQIEKKLNKVLKIDD